MEPGELGESTALVIEADERLEPSALRRQFAEYMTEVTLSGWRGRLTVVFRNLESADAVPVDALLFLSRRASDCDVLLETCHPDVLRLLEAPPYRSHFNLLTAASKPAADPAAM